MSDGQTSTSLSLKAAVHLALKWKSLGFSVFPILISQDAKGHLNKQPIFKTWQVPVTDLDVLKRQFEEAYHRRHEGEVLGVGLVPGTGGVIVFDLDVKNNGRGYQVADEISLPTSPYTLPTPSGGEHRWMKKLNGERIGNSVPEHWVGSIDIRADNGYIVAPGTITPWGSWGLGPDQFDLDALPLLSLEIWEQLEKLASGAKRHGWGRYLPDMHDSDLDPRTVRAHTYLVENFDIDSTLTCFCANGDDPSYLKVTRPDKDAGTSATIGLVGPGAMKVFTSNWPPFREGKVYDIEALIEISEGIDHDFKKDVATELHRIRVRETARSKIEEEQQELLAPSPPMYTVAQKHKMGRPPVAWLLKDVLRQKGRGLVIAQKKAGKTTFLLNFCRSLITGEPFLGEFEVTPLAGRILYLNYELEESQMDEWAEEICGPTDQLIAWTLTGCRNPLISETGRRNLIHDLRDLGCEMLLVDPILSARGNFTEGAENDNSSVTGFLIQMRALTVAANVPSLVIAAHAGVQTGRARGASALEGWPDTIFMLDRPFNTSGEFDDELTGDDPRFLSLDGREKKKFTNRHIGFGSDRKMELTTLHKSDFTEVKKTQRSTQRKEQTAQKHLDSIITLLRTEAHPLTRNEIYQHLKSRTAYKTIIDTALAQGLLKAEAGPRGAQLISLPD